MDNKSLNNILASIEKLSTEDLYFLKGYLDSEIEERTRKAKTNGNTLINN